MELKEKIKRWIDTINKDKQKASQFYYKAIFPEISKKFVKNFPYKNYDYLISLVGYSELPVILSILGVAPKKVLFLYTEETESKIPFIVEKTSLSTPQIEKLKISAISEHEIHRAIKYFIEDKDKSRILLDITGGKKSMIGAAAQSALVLQIDAGYIDGEYIHDLRQPNPGTEYFRILETPSEMKPIRSLH